MKRSHTCGGKRRFHDQAEAVRALHTLTSRSTRTTIPSRAYECPRCKGWHLTSQAAR